MVTGDGVTALRIQVLGPVRAWTDDDELDLGTPQQRAVLTALALREGRQATLEALIDAVWGADPPRTSALTLRTYISRLRQSFGPGAIETVNGGYRLRLGPGTLDLADYTAAVARARTAREAGEQCRAAQAFQQADGLWRGPALADVPGPYAAAQRARLERERRAAVEERLALDVGSGRPAAAVTELTALVEQHPLDEGLSALLMLGLYRTGRQAMAVAEFHRIRELLSGELGLDPGPALRDVYQRILNGEPTPPVEEPAAVPAPGQLPPGIRDFVGRTDLIEQVTGLLLADGLSAPAVGLAGLGGVGTSTLAVHVAHRLRDRFPDGQLYADLRDGDDRAVLSGFLRALGVPVAEVPDDPAEQAALWRTVSHGRRLLVVLDHARAPGQLKVLLPAGSGSAAIVTGGRRVPGITRWFSVPPFDPDDSVELFRRVAGRDRVDAEREAALRFAAACSHLPLAVRLGAERLAARPTWSVAAIGERLRVEMRQPVALHEDCVRVEAPFERDLAALRATDPFAAVAFGLVALSDDPEITTAGAARLLDLPETEAERLMESMADAHLVEPAGYQRYRYLEIVRWFARRQAIAAHTPRPRTPARPRPARTLTS
ncbi:BTAD domain-containing putative transcriptional regulator [Actinoplanes sp. NPDC000266]